MSFATTWCSALFAPMTSTRRGWRKNRCCCSRRRAIRTGRRTGPGKPLPRRRRQPGLHRKKTRFESKVGSIRQEGTQGALLFVLDANDGKSREVGLRLPVACHSERSEGPVHVVRISNV